MYDIELDYHLDRESTTSLNPWNQISASHEKIKRFYLLDNSESEDIEESDGTEDNDTTDCKNWIMDSDILQSSICEIADCGGCHGNLSLTEMKSHRAELATKFELCCQNSECCSKVEFYTTEKTEKVFHIYRKMVPGFYLIGKEHTAARKVTSVLGLGVTSTLS